MELEQVVKLLELMKSHGLEEIEIEQGDTRIKIRKGSNTPAGVASVITTPLHVTPINGIIQTAAASPASVAVDAPAPDDPETFEITSPMVGTFYHSRAPDAEPFVSEGDAVSSDTVICIIEAMKVMNEIKAEHGGEVVQFLVEDGESVEFGQPIMVIRKTEPTQ